jgi:hypothetical protein
LRGGDACALLCILVLLYLQDLVGLSRRTIIFNCICTAIIFLYLLDAEETSFLILISVGISLVLDLWKVR